MEDGDRIEHDAGTGSITITFERFENEDDVVLPNFRVAVSTSEHVLAWVEELLSSRRCKRIHSPLSEKRLKATLRATQQDHNLVYLCGAQHHVVLVRDGRVLKVQFTQENLNRFMERLGESPKTDATTTTTTNAEFIAFVRGLMR